MGPKEFCGLTPKDGMLIFLIAHVFDPNPLMVSLRRKHMEFVQEILSCYGFRFVPLVSPTWGGLLLKECTHVMVMEFQKWSSFTDARVTELLEQAEAQGLPIITIHEPTVRELLGFWVWPRPAARKGDD